MAPRKFTDQELAEAVEARAAYPTVKAAARALGLKSMAMHRRLVRAAELGLLPPAPAATPPGFVIREHGVRYDRSGTISGQSVKMTREHGAVFAVPAGHDVKGVSAFVDAEGREVGKWIKTDRQAVPTADVIATIKAAFADFEPAALPAVAPNFVNADLLSIYPIVDLHLGLFSWGRETGADYDVKIASGLLKDAMSNLVARSAASETALIIDMGDYFHTDSSRNQTARSSNPLDVDTRYARVVQVGIELVVWTIELALQKHAKVIYRKLPGNHDDETSLMLAVALSAWFRNEPRVTIDTDPSRFFMMVFGGNMLAATHGDMLKMGDMASYMASAWPKAWGATDYRFGFTGHVHHDKVKSGNGVRVESFNTIAAKDAWHAGMGYQADRSAISITMHKTCGEVDRLTVNLPKRPPSAANDNIAVAA